MGGMRNIVHYRELSLVPNEHSAEIADISAVRVAIIIPCYKVREQISTVLANVGDDVDDIYVVDDCCPEQTGDFVQSQNSDPRVRVIFHRENEGVGGATLTGFRQAIADGATILVKIDGDGQMDPLLLPIFINAIRHGEADYAKGNRFYDPAGLAEMPRTRLLGNAALSFMAKLSTGYWNSFDPTNGYIAIHAEVARHLPFEKIAKRYFFETDLLFRLNIIQARVADVPMPASYGSEKSNLRVIDIILPFIAGHTRNFFKRIFYNYFLRDFSIASLELIAGLALIAFGCFYGLANFRVIGGGASAGIVMLAGLPIILGMQLLLAFISYDIQSIPHAALHPKLLGSRNAAPRRA